MGNEPFENSGLYPHEQPNFLNQLFQEGTTSLPNTNTLVDAASQVTAFQLDDLAGSMPGATSQSNSAGGLFGKQPIQQPFRGSYGANYDAIWFLGRANTGSIADTHGTRADSKFPAKC